jgi:apolipoprotein N-acyltransferase
MAWLAWPGLPFTFLIFFAWIPLLRVAEGVEKQRHFLGLCYLSMLTWNLGTTWWIWNATAPGAVAAWLANSFLMCIPWMGFRYFRKKLSPLLGYLILIGAWMSFEWLHLQDWGLSWPWLTLGNVFASRPEWIQWYQYTGVAGGTLWILLVNLFLYHHWKMNTQQCGAKNYKWLMAGAALVIIPVGVSVARYSSREITDTADKKEVVVVQPNIDPYEKVTATSANEQVEKLLQLTRAASNSETALVIWPETALYSPYGFDEEKLNQYSALQPIYHWLNTYQQSSLFTGIESFRWMSGPTKYSSSTIEGKMFYEAYNGSILVDKNGTAATYHKSMLVPGVETLPWFLRFLDSWFQKFGGVTAGYAKQEKRSLLQEKNGFQIAPAICYESIYGNFMRQSVKEGANIIAIITNDGWWKKTPGHIQHLHYARLRAIETGTWVARSANTGISAIIDPSGKIIDSRGYNIASTLRYSIPITPPVSTFYVKHGDWLFQLMAVLTILLAGLAWLSLGRRRS